MLKGKWKVNGNATLVIPMWFQLSRVYDQDVTTFRYGCQFIEVYMVVRVYNNGEQVRSYMHGDKVYYHENELIRSIKTA